MGGNKVVNIIIPPKQSRGIAPSPTRSPSQTPAAKKDEKLAQCDSRCYGLAEQAGISR